MSFDKEHTQKQVAHLTLARLLFQTYHAAIHTLYSQQQFFICPLGVDLGRVVSTSVKLRVGSQLVFLHAQQLLVVLNLKQGTIHFILRTT